MVAGVVTLVWVAACSEDATAPTGATRLAFTVQPSGTAGGQVLTPAVQVAVQDASGNAVTTATNAITVAIGTNPSGGTLAGTTTVAAVNGVATFSTLHIDKASSGYRLAASATGLMGATSAAFAVAVGDPANLAFTGQPTSAVAGQVVTPAVQVAIRDAGGNLVTVATNSVALAVGTPIRRAGRFLGRVTASAVNGVATFPTLLLDAGRGYTLVATSGTLVGVRSKAFTIYAAPTTGIFYHGGPIIYTPKVAALYWSGEVIYSGGPRPGTAGTGAQDGSLVGFFLRHLGGSPYFNINSTYYDATNTHVQNVLTYTRYWADAAPPRSAPTDADIRAEIERGLQRGALTYDPSTLYAVFTGPGVNLGGGFFPADTGYCGYHSFFVDTLLRNIKYAAMPHDQDYNPNSHTPYVCSFQGTESPNDDPAADAEVDALAHEIEETTTDEELNAWFDLQADTLYEIGDLCNFQFGPTFMTNNGTPANQTLGGRPFLVQMNWVNEETARGTPVGCVQGWPPSGLAATHPGHRVQPNSGASHGTPSGPHKMGQQRMPQ